MHKMFRALVVVIAAACFASPEGWGQSWPQRPVRVIVPLPVGTAIDVSLRLFGEQLAGQWKQAVLVENIPGVDGVLAAREFVNRTRTAAQRLG